MNNNSGISIQQYGRRLISNGMWFFFSSFFALLRVAGLMRVVHNGNVVKKIDSPMIIASNHERSMDPSTLGAAFIPSVLVRLLPITSCGAPLHRLQKTGQRVAKAFGVIQAIYFLFNVECIPEAESFSQKVEPFIKAVGRGESVLIFPEGSASSHAGVRPFKRGVAHLHRQTKAPIMPCAIHYYKKGFFSSVVVVLGEPVYIPEHIYDTGGNEAAAEHLRVLVDQLYATAVASK